MASPKLQLTANMLETNMGELDAAISELRDANFFDVADILGTTMLFLRALQKTEALPWEAIVDEEPVTGDMNALRELCVQMKELQQEALNLKSLQAEVKIPLDDLRLRKIPDMMEALQVKTATFSGIGRVQTAPDLYCSTVKGRKGDAMAWLRDCGYDDMISETYNSGTMKALIRRLMTEGTEIPDFMNVTPFIRASVVKV